MSDTQSLLSSSHDNSRRTIKGKSESNTFFRCCQCFGIKWTDDEYEQLDDDDDDDDDDSNKKKRSVNFFKLFRFADQTDLILISIGLCAMVFSAILMTTNLVLLGKVTGTFTMQPLNNTVPFEQYNTSIPTQIENKCLQDIEVNSNNYSQLKKMCNNSDSTTSSFSSDFPMKTLHNGAMNKLYLLLVLGSIEFLCTCIQYFALIISAKRQTSRMRMRLFQSLIQRNISYYDTHSISRISAKLFDNIESIERGIGFEFSLLFLSVCYVTTNAIASLFINWKLTLILLCIMPMLIGCLYLFSRLTTNEIIKELKTYSKAAKIIEEVFSSLRTVLSLNGQKFEQKRYERELHGTRWSSVRKGAMLGLFAGSVYFIIYFIYFLGFIIGSYILSDDRSDNIYVSSILIIVVLLAESINDMSSLSPCFQSITEACSAAVQIFNLIDEAEVINVNEKDILKDNNFDKRPIGINSNIEFVNVNFAYPARKNAVALQNINLIARAGKITALVGRSGSGKSTCLSLLLRYYEPLSGKIIIDGQSISEYNIKHLRENIGVVSQEPILFNTSIYENIRYGKENATKAEIEEAARQASAHDFIMELPNKYETIVGEGSFELSGGEKQRVALARVLVKQPNILLLDEATSALDNRSENIVKEALDQACKNRTTIIIAHHLSTIQHADHIYVFDNGNITEQGTHEILIEKDNGLYQQMINIQQNEIIDDDDNNDETMSETEIRAENQNNISKISPLVNETYYGDMNKKKVASSNVHASFLRLLSMNRPEWISILIGCLMSIIGGASQVVVAILLPKTSKVLSDNKYTEDHHKAIVASCLFLAMGVIVLFVRFFQFTAFAISGSKLTERIRAKAFSTLLRQEVAYFDQSENNASMISNHLSSDAHAVQQMTGPRLGMICEAAIMILAALIVSFIFNYQLALILLAYLVFLIVIICFDVSVRAKIAEHTEHIYEQANALVEGVLDNIHTVKHLTAEKKILQQYFDLINQSFTIQRNPLIFSTIAFSLIFSTYVHALVFIYWCALVLVKNNKLDAADMIMIFAFVPFLLQITQVCWIIIEDGGSLVSNAKFFFDLFDRIPTIDNGSTEGQELKDFHGDIEFDQVKFKYASRSAAPSILSNFRLSIKQGQRVALVGASGCGKSTVIQLMERFYDVTQGQLRFDGVDIRQLNINSVRSCLGLVSQEPILFDMTIAENISYPRDDVLLEDIINAATKANIHQFIQQLPMGYETRVGSKGHHLSGGEKQRIALARALLRQPKLLLLDDATSAMDPYNEQAIQHILEQIQSEDSTRTMLIISHSLSIIRSCDFIYVLKNGRIIESGTHKDLILRHEPNYRMLTRYHL